MIQEGYTSSISCIRPRVRQIIILRNAGVFTFRAEFGQCLSLEDSVREAQSLDENTVPDDIVS